MIIHSKFRGDELLGSLLNKCNLRGNWATRNAVELSLVKSIQRNTRQGANLSVMINVFSSKFHLKHNFYKQNY